MPAAQNLKPRKSSDTLSNSELHQRILDTTVALFVEAGYSQVTTNLIAERAGVSVGSIYRFYPNKFAIFNAVVENFFAALDQTVETFLLDADPNASWEQHIDLLTERISAHWIEHKALIGAWGVLSGNPEINKADANYVSKSTARITNYLQAIMPGRSAREYQNVSRLIYVTALGALDAAVLLQEHDEELITEYKKMLKAYAHQLMR